MSTRLQSSNASIARDVTRMVRGSETSDGAGVRLRRYIGTPELNMLDPFLLLDVFRSDDPGDYIAGFPPHPHRGFETVTYLLHGRMRHRDSVGHQGVIQAGGVQWMTAGRGIEHSEMPEQEQGLLYGFQLWVNLPASDKMVEPRYQEFSSEQIPLEQSQPGVSLRVIAGRTRQGTEGVIRNNAAEATYLDVSVEKNASFEQDTVRGHSVFVYVIEGVIEVLGHERNVTVPAESLVVLNDGDRLVIQGREDSRALLVAGRPFKQPVARHGPFVMNTAEEIEQALSDYREGRFGQINAETE